MSAASSKINTAFSTVSGSISNRVVIAFFVISLAFTSCSKIRFPCVMRGSFSQNLRILALVSVSTPSASAAGSSSSDSPSFFSFNYADLLICCAIVMPIMTFFTASWFSFVSCVTSCTNSFTSFFFTSSFPSILFSLPFFCWAACPPPLWLTAYSVSINSVAALIVLIMNLFIYSGACAPVFYASTV